MLFVLAYLAGVLTIFAPCILPVLPFVFARADQPFAKTGLPLLAGMALAFAGVASLAAVAGSWAAQANDYGRVAALVFLAVAGTALVAPRVAGWLTRPLVSIGNRLAGRAQSASAGGGRSVPASLLLGVATGLLWAPCAGPILGLILTGAAIEGPSAHASLLLLAYAAGAATSMAALLLLGQRLLAVARRSLGIGEWIRKGLGVAVLAGVAAVALGLDTGVLAQWSSDGVARVERKLLDRLRPEPSVADTGGLLRTAMPVLDLPVLGNMPPITGAVEWLNSPPLTAAQLKGKVVLIDFWTFGCYNCRNALPYVRAWHNKYKDQGLVVIGVHAPEFAFEKNIANVRRALIDLDVPFPVAVDNNFTIWRAFSNQYWPAHYFVDAQGKVRFQHVGEGEYDKSEQVIRQLLQEAAQNRSKLPAPT